MKDDRIEEVSFWPMDIPLRDPFVVATGTRVVAENVFVRVTLQSGVCGFGEAAPFPEVGGEDRPSCIDTLALLAPSLVRHPIHNYRQLAQQMADQAPGHPAARCGLETALLDAYCHSTGVPMWEFWGGTDVRPRETDITIPISAMDDTLTLARHWHQKGFRLFKMKIGTDVDSDIRRVEAVHKALPDVAFIGDGNQGFSREECLAFADGLRRFGGKLLLLEQPVERNDLESLAYIRRTTGIPVAADESVRSLADVLAVVDHQAADYVNIKIMKTGVLEATEIASFALKSGLRLMIGGMIESRLAMGCSFSLVLGMNGFDVLDLDTPLLLASDPIQGGYRYDGPMLQPWTCSGLGLSVPRSQ